MLPYSLALVDFYRATNAVPCAIPLKYYLNVHPPKFSKIRCYRGSTIKGSVLKIRVVVAVSAQPKLDEPGAMVVKK